MAPQPAAAHPVRWRLGARAAVASLLALMPSSARAATYTATGFDLLLGTEESGVDSYMNTQDELNGVDHVLYESSVSPKRLDAIYRFGTITDTNLILHMVLTKATTGGGPGHDNYSVAFTDDDNCLPAGDDGSHTGSYNGSHTGSHGGSYNWRNFRDLRRHNWSCHLQGHCGVLQSWAIYNARKYWVRDIPLDKVTHVNYAFANLAASTRKVVIGDVFADITNRKDPDAQHNPQPGELPGGNIPQLLFLRDNAYNGHGPHSHLKVIISVGGWSWSEHFSALASTPEGRHDFAESVKQFVAGYPEEADGTVHQLSGELDGVDLDWEFPTGDPDNCGLEGNGCELYDPCTHALLILAVRAKLDEFGTHKEVSIAMPAGYWLIEKVMPPIVSNSYLKACLSDHGMAHVIMKDTAANKEWPLQDQTATNALDYIHIMNYDMSGASYSARARHHAPLYGYEGPSGDPDAGQPDFTERVNSHFAIQAYSYVHTDYSYFDPDSPSLNSTTGVGIFPMEKLTFGMPMYGKGFKVDGNGAYDNTYPLLFETNRGIGSGNNIPKGTWDGGQWGNSGIWAYWDIFTNLGGNNPGMIDPSNREYSSYVLGGSDVWIGFDDIALQTAKAKYAVDNGMAGVMFWSFPGDISSSTERQGQTNFGDTYPTHSLVHNLANQL
ncbi:hypothetical protein ACHAXT_003348 [Thalassiosira profunda]